MTWIVDNVRLTFTPIDHELEEVEPQDENDSGYLWKEVLGESVTFQAISGGFEICNEEDE